MGVVYEFSSHFSFWLVNKFQLSQFMNLVMVQYRICFPSLAEDESAEFSGD